jgi:uncharacterized protein
MDMQKLAGFVGMTVGGAIGWYAGAPIGYMTAFMLSCVGSGVGLYVTRRVLQQYFVLVLGVALVAAPPSRAQTPGSLKAAQELTTVMHADKQLHDQISAAFDLQVKNNPESAKYRGVLQQFADKYVTWDILGPQIVAAYAQLFTEQELRDMIAFYRTPTGQKVAAQQAALVAKEQEISLQAVQAHQAELADLIRQQQQSPPDTTHH